MKRKEDNRSVFRSFLDEVRENCIMIVPEAIDTDWVCVTKKAFDAYRQYCEKAKDQNNHDRTK